MMGHLCLDNQITSYYCRCNLKSYLDSQVFDFYTKMVCIKVVRTVVLILLTRPPLLALLQV